ncbi:MAG: MurR/RpiR family transcriptional regulator [Longibaculum sp.]
MNIYTKMNQITNFTQAQQNFVDFIIEHPQDVINLNVNQLAKASFVSVSTIYRVIEKLQLSGLSQLKMMVSSQYEAYLHENKNTDYNYPFQKNATHHQIMSQMLSLYEQTLSSTFNLIDLEMFLKVIQIIDQANHIALFPTIGNFFMAECFQQNMLEIGKRVEVYTQSYYQHWSATTYQKDDVVIVISYANRAPWLLDIMKDLSRSEATIVLISSTHENQLSQFVDYHLYFCSYEDSEEKIASFSSRISLQYLLDCLYACYFNRNYDKHLKYRLENYID